MTYAAGTEVPISKTKGEIDALLRRYKATGFGVFEEAREAKLVFVMHERRIMMKLPIPDRNDKRFTEYLRGSVLHRRTAEAALAQWDQASRSRWRAFYLCIKAKLESIDSGIETFEDAFLAHVMMPDGKTVGEATRPAIKQAYIEYKNVPLLQGY